MPKQPRRTDPGYIRRERVLTAKRQYKKDAMDDDKDIPFDIERAKASPFGYYGSVPHPEYRISKGALERADDVRTRSVLTKEEIQEFNLHDESVRYIETHQFGEVSPLPEGDTWKSRFHRGQQIYDGDMDYSDERRVAMDKRRHTPGRKRKHEHKRPLMKDGYPPMFYSRRDIEICAEEETGGYVSPFWYRFTGVFAPRSSAK